MITEALMKRGREAAVAAAEAVDKAKKLIDPDWAGDQSDRGYVAWVADLAFKASLRLGTDFGLTTADHYALGMAELFYFPVDCLGMYTEDDLNKVIVLLNALAQTVVLPAAENKA